MKSASGTWSVDGTRTPGLLELKLEGTLSEAEMAAFVAEHNRAISAFGSRDYKVFVDLRRMKPLSLGAAALFEAAKRFSNDHVNFRGSAVLVQSAIVAMQHRRTSVAGGVMDTELISDDEAECRRHLAKVFRTG